jgi:hypothetical protein
MALEMKVYREVRAYEAHVMFGLSWRQLGALAVGIPLAGAVFAAIAYALHQAARRGRRRPRRDVGHLPILIPVAAWGWWRPKGLKPEKFFGYLIRHYLTGKVITYDDTYRPANTGQQKPNRYLNPEHLPSRRAAPAEQPAAKSASGARCSSRASSDDTRRPSRSPASRTHAAPGESALTTPPSPASSTPRSALSSSGYQAMLPSGVAWLGADEWSLTLRISDINYWPPNRRSRGRGRPWARFLNSFGAGTRLEITVINRVLDEADVGQLVQKPHAGDGWDEWRDDFQPHRAWQAGGRVLQHRDREAADDHRPGARPREGRGGSHSAGHETAAQLAALEEGCRADILDRANASR